MKEFGSHAGEEAAIRAYIERIQDVTRAIVRGDTPVVGAVRGWAVGGWLEWVINCDFAIASEGTRFFFPEIGLGVFVTGGVTALLPRVIGLQRTRSLIMLGERFDATQALQWGLLSKVVSDEAGFELAELGRFATSDGQFREGAFAAYAAVRPWMWGKLIGLGRNSSRAVVALTNEIQRQIE